MKTFLFDAGLESAPYESLSYVIGELNYGGRVTDFWDRRLLISLLRTNFSKKNEDKLMAIINNKQHVKYTPPPFGKEGDINAVEQTISKWPVATTGEDVGLASNAYTIIQRNDVLKIFGQLIEIQPTFVASSETTSKDEFALKTVQEIREKIPHLLMTPRKRNEISMFSVLEHEIALYNSLLNVITESLDKLISALKGLIVFDDELEKMQKKLLINKVPDQWKSVMYPSILSLSQFLDDLRDRVGFIDSWNRKGDPVVYKLSAFFNPEEFITTVAQNYARSNNYSFDSLSWKTIPIADEKPTKPPVEGVYVEGIKIEGAKWNSSISALSECNQTDILSNLPILHLLPKSNENLVMFDLLKLNSNLYINWPASDQNFMEFSFVDIIDADFEVVISFSSLIFSLLLFISSFFSSTFVASSFFLFSNSFFFLILSSNSFNFC